jgi:large subunit ribosomal protein L5
MTSTKITTQEYFLQAKESLIKDLPSTNTFSISQISKISINIGVGKFEAKEKLEIADYLTKLTGQKPKQIGAKKAISNFKTRKGDLVGLSVTLRGKKAHDFLLYLIYIALPRTRDFKGIKFESFDKNNAFYSLGIENSSIFPVVGFDSSTIFGMQINVVFKQPSINNRELLKKLNFPFKKD